VASTLDSDAEELKKRAEREKAKAQGTGRKAGQAGLGILKRYQKYNDITAKFRAQASQAPSPPAVEQKRGTISAGPPKAETPVSVETTGASNAPSRPVVSRDHWSSQTPVSLETTGGAATDRQQARLPNERPVVSRDHWSSQTPVSLETTGASTNLAAASGPVSNARPVVSTDHWSSQTPVSLETTGLPATEALEQKTPPAAQEAFRREGDASVAPKLKNAPSKLRGRLNEAKPGKPAQASGESPDKLKKAPGVSPQA
jgi:hypothetical protein